ncbi:MAG: CoA transferase, partial [Desulfobacula sp.]|nr:CoA transferase [Desulfobacula sp.]
LEQWEEEFGELDLCWGPVNNLMESLQDKHLRHRETIVDFQDQNGNLTTTLGVCIKLDKTPGSLRTPPVDFGENTSDILKELGYSKNEIDIFFNTDIV